MGVLSSVPTFASLAHPHLNQCLTPSLRGLWCDPRRLCIIYKEVLMAEEMCPKVTGHMGGDRDVF